MSEIIEIRYLSDDMPKLNYIEGSIKSNWIDLYSRKEINLKKGEFALIPLGIAMKLPEGYEAHVAPRSSTFKNWGIIQTNSVGVIDNAYCGDEDEWMMPVFATRNTTIEKNSRVCQFRIMKCQPQIQFMEKEHLSEINRGGFGTTGKQ